MTQNILLFNILFRRNDARTKAALRFFCSCVFIARGFMYHVLLISEDRLFLKKIYPLLEDESRFCIHVVPFSMDAAASFKKFHVDAVIMDTTLFIPYESILNELKDCQWNYSIILISSQNKSIPKEKNIYVVEKSNISKEIFMDFFDRIFGEKKQNWQADETIFINWNGTNSILLNYETYHLVYMRSFENKEVFNQKSVQLFAETISSYAKINIVFAKDKEFFILLPRQNLKSEFNFAHLTQDAFSVFGSKAALLYDSSINRKKILSECSLMKKMAAYSYFFNGKSFSIQDLNTKNIVIEEKILHAQCQPLLQALLYADTESAVHIVRELYFKTIRQYLNFETLEYIRLQLNFFYKLFTKEIIDFNFSCLEEEIEFILNTSLFKNRGKALSVNLIKSVISIYNSFQTNISLEGIAHLLERNKIYLNRIYKENFDLTILDTLQYLRLEHAKFYLAHTKLKVAQIADATGFSDIGYFSKFFHHETGLTALDYRNHFSKQSYRDN